MSNTQSPAPGVAAEEFRDNTLKSVANWLRGRSNTAWAEKFKYTGLMQEWADDLDGIRTALQASAAAVEPAAWHHNKTHGLYDDESDVPLGDGGEWAEPLYLQPPTSAQAWKEGFRAGDDWRCLVDGYYEAGNFGAQPEPPDNPYVLDQFADERAVNETSRAPVAWRVNLNEGHDIEPCLTYYTNKPDRLDSFTKVPLYTAPPLPAQVQAAEVTDEQADEIANACYRELLVTTTYSGGMGGVTWDRSLVRAAICAARAPLGNKYPVVKIEDCELIEFDSDQADGEFALVPLSDLASRTPATGMAPREVTAAEHDALNRALLRSSKVVSGAPGMAGGVAIGEIPDRNAPWRAAPHPAPAQQAAGSDDKRLNFLSQRGGMVITSDDEHNKWCVEVLGGTDNEGVTLRMAIDAAYEGVTAAGRAGS